MWLWLKYLEITIPSERIRYIVFNLKLYGKPIPFYTFAPKRKQQTWNYSIK